MYPKSTFQMDFASIKSHSEKNKKGKKKKKPYIGFNVIMVIQHLEKKKKKKLHIWIYGIILLKKNYVTYLNPWWLLMFY